MSDARPDDERERHENKTSLSECPLFHGLAERDVITLLRCLSSRERRYEKGETALREGDPPTFAGIVRSGRVLVVKDDYFGKRHIVAEVGPGGLFAESLVCAEAETSPVTVIAAVKSTLLLIEYSGIITTCPNACGFHTILIKNMMRILAMRNRQLIDKLEHLTRPNVREKALSYLSERAKAQGTAVFEIPFDRQGLADYLAVDRSALSRQLSALRDEGVIKFRKNRFELVGGA
jgi:CRP-like cAMP-binding protein